MSQTPSQRRREIDDARRRSLNAVLEQLAREQPARRTLAGQIAGVLGLFGSDELELVDRLTSAIILACARTPSQVEYPLQAIAAVVSRLLRGRAHYGELTINSDPRDFDLEYDEELSDSIVYDAIRRIRSEREESPLDQRIYDMVGGHQLLALDNVGAHVQHSTLAALVQRVQDAERPTPFEIPPPWCLGSALLFSLGSVRIADGTIVALRCNHCGREWSLSSNELRVTGNGQYVIPTHEGRRSP